MLVRLAHSQNYLTLSPNKEQVCRMDAVCHAAPLLLGLQSMQVPLASDSITDGCLNCANYQVFPCACWCCLITLCSSPEHPVCLICSGGVSAGNRSPPSCDGAGKPPVQLPRYCLGFPEPLPLFSHRLQPLLHNHGRQTHTRSRSRRCRHCCHHQQPAREQQQQYTAAQPKHPWVRPLGFSRGCKP